MIWKRVAAIVITSALPALAQQPESVLDDHDENRGTAEEHYRIGRYFVDQGATEIALGHLEYAVALNPRHQEALRELGVVHYLEGTSPRARGLAEHYFSKLLELNPRDVSALTYRSTVRLAEGWFEAAESDARAALEIEPDNDASSMLLGSSLLRQRRFREAANVYRKTLAGKPSDLLARWNLALATDQAGGDRESIPPELQVSYPPRDAAPSPVRFTNVAHALGVDAPSRGRGNAWADFNKDGREDLFCVGIGDPHALFTSLDEGSFEDVTSESGLEDPRGGWSALAADYDNDGDADLYVTRDGWEGPGANSLYLNDGRGHFVDVAAKAGIAAPSDSFTAAFADYDRDGFLDLYTWRTGSRCDKVLQMCSTAIWGTGGSRT